MSHVVVALLGAAAGAVYESEVLSTRSVLSQLSRRPVLDASILALRFGTPDHARVTLESVARMPATNALEWGDRMTAELRLAALDGELQASANPAPHLAAALAACRRFKGPDCKPEELRALAATLMPAKR